MTCTNCRHRTWICSPSSATAIATAVITPAATIIRAGPFVIVTVAAVAFSLLHRSNSYHSTGSATVRDSVGNTFRHSYFQRGSLGISQYSASPMYLPMHITDDLKYSGGLTDDLKLNLKNLKD
jgi:hypothetical protein